MNIIVFNSLSATDPQWVISLIRATPGSPYRGHYRDAGLAQRGSAAVNR